jgi:hypothetical protein
MGESWNWLNPLPHRSRMFHLATDKIGLALAAIELTKDHNVLEDLPTR